MFEAQADYSRLGELVGGLGLHEHLCLIYDTQEEQFAAALPYLRIGLERGEKCLYIVDENTAAGVLDALRRGGTDVDHYLGSGALTITHKQEAFLKQGRFDPDWMIGFLTQATADAGAARFSGLRTLLGEMTWVLGASNGTGALIEYESKLNRFVRHHDARVVCQYNRARFSPEVILGIIRTHPLVVYGGIVCKNPYYIPPDEFLRQNPASQEVERLLHNILTLERAEQALRHSDEVLRLVIDTIPTMAWTVRPDGAVDFINQRWLDYTGLTFEEEIEEPTRVIHPEDLQRVMEKWLEKMAAGESLEDEMRLRGADGEYRWFLVRTVPLRDERRNIVKWYGSSIDIEDRKRAEDDLRRQKEILQKIFDNVPAMIGFVGPDGKIKLANREWERTLGWTLEEVLGQDLDVFAELYPDPKYRQEVLNFVFKSNAEWADFRTRARDGRVIDTSWANVLLSDGTTIGIGRDITDFKRAEEALQKSRDQLRALAARVQSVREDERTRVAREIHDELGQALTAIKIDFSSLSHDLPADKKQQAESILKLVDETIQSVRRISTELRPAILDAVGLVAAVEWAASEFAARTGTKCQLDVPQDDVVVDEECATALFRIFQETLTNVARHANATEVNVRLAEEDGNLTLEVHDNGKGVSEEQLSVGSSLGILGMQERTLLLGGEFTIAGALGAGTTVRVRIPETGPHRRRTASDQDSYCR
jgi:PAS domain S-box-containing protein